MSSADSRLKRTRVSTRRWRNASRGVTMHTEVWTRWLRPDSSRRHCAGFVEQFRLRQNAAADRDDGVGGEDIGAAQFVIELDGFQRRMGLGVRQPVGVGARQLATLRRLVDVRGLERVRLDPALIEQGETARRT